MRKSKMRTLESSKSELVKKIEEGSKCLEDYRSLGKIYWVFWKSCG